MSLSGLHGRDGSEMIRTTNEFGAWTTSIRGSFVTGHGLTRPICVSNRGEGAPTAGENTLSYFLGVTAPIGPGTNGGPPTVAWTAASGGLTGTFRCAIARYDKTTETDETLMNGRYSNSTEMSAAVTVTVASKVTFTLNTGANKATDFLGDDATDQWTHLAFIIFDNNKGIAYLAATLEKTSSASSYDVTLTNVALSAKPKGLWLADGVGGIYIPAPAVRSAINYVSGQALGAQRLFLTNQYGFDPFVNGKAIAPLGAPGTGAPDALYGDQWFTPVSYDNSTGIATVDDFDPTTLLDYSSGSATVASAGYEIVTNKRGTVYFTNVEDLENTVSALVDVSYKVLRGGSPIGVTVTYAPSLYCDTLGTAIAAGNTGDIHFSNQSSSELMIYGVRRGGSPLANVVLVTTGVFGGNLVGVYNKGPDPYLPTIGDVLYGVVSFSAPDVTVSTGGSSIAASSAGQVQITEPVASVAVLTYIVKRAGAVLSGVSLTPLNNLTNPLTFYNAGASSYTPHVDDVLASNVVFNEASGSAAWIPSAGDKLVALVDVGDGRWLCRVTSGVDGREIMRGFISAATSDSFTLVPDLGRVGTNYPQYNTLECALTDSRWYIRKQVLGTFTNGSRRVVLSEPVAEQYMVWQNASCSADGTAGAFGDQAIYKIASSGLNSLSSGETSGTDLILFANYAGETVTGLFKVAPNSTSVWAGLGDSANWGSLGATFAMAFNTGTPIAGIGICNSLVTVICSKSNIFRLGVDKIVDPTDILTLAEFDVTSNIDINPIVSSFTCVAPWSIASTPTQDLTWIGAEGVWLFNGTTVALLNKDTETIRWGRLDQPNLISARTCCESTHKFGPVVRAFGMATADEPERPDQELAFMLDRGGWLNFSGQAKKSAACMAVNFAGQQRMVFGASGRLYIMGGGTGATVADAQGVLRPTDSFYAYPYCGETATASGSITFAGQGGAVQVTGATISSLSSGTITLADSTGLVNGATYTPYRYNETTGVQEALDVVLTCRLGGDVDTSGGGSAIAVNATGAINVFAGTPVVGAQYVSTLQPNVVLQNTSGSNFRNIGTESYTNSAGDTLVYRVTFQASSNYTPTKYRPTASPPSGDCLVQDGATYVVTNLDADFHTPSPWMWQLSDWQLVKWGRYTNTVQTARIYTYDSPTSLVVVPDGAWCIEDSLNGDPYMIGPRVMEIELPWEVAVQRYSSVRLDRMTMRLEDPGYQSIDYPIVLTQYQSGAAPTVSSTVTHQWNWSRATFQNQFFDTTMLCAMTKVMKLVLKVYAPVTGDLNFSEIEFQIRPGT